jgi:hypothetical protein
VDICNVRLEKVERGKFEEPKKAEDNGVGALRGRPSSMCVAANLGLDQQSRIAYVTQFQMG